MANTTKKQLKYFILDVDGVLNDGKYHYTSEGKVVKVFGPDDHDALLMLSKDLEIVFVTGDKKGFPITKKRVEIDMKFPLHQVSTFERTRWIEERFDPKEVIYMGDGIFDAMIFNSVGYGIAPANAFFKTKEHADYVTQASGGDSAVAEACWHIAEKFFEPWDSLNLSLKKNQGEWGEK